MSRIVVSAQGVGKTVPTQSGELVILDGIDLEINEGESVAIVGASGSGKTTLLGILAGLDVASGGVVRLVDVNLNELDEEERALARGRHVGFVFQSFHSNTSHRPIPKVHIETVLFINSSLIMIREHYKRLPEIVHA